MDLVQLGHSGSARSARSARTIALSHLPSCEDRSCRSEKVTSYLLESGEGALEATSFYLLVLRTYFYFKGSWVLLIFFLFLIFYLNFNRVLLNDVSGDLLYAPTSQQQSATPASLATKERERRRGYQGGNAGDPPVSLDAQGTAAWTSQTGRHFP